MSAPSDEQLAQTRRRMRALNFVVYFILNPCLFFGVGYLVYSVAFDERKSCESTEAKAAFAAAAVSGECTEPWTLTDIAYFAVVTASTVGYGDFSPTASLGPRAFTIFYILWGVVFVFSAFASEVNDITAKGFLAFSGWLEKIFPQKGIDITGDGVPDFHMPRHWVIGYGKHLLGHFLFSSDLTAVGWLGVLFGLASGLGFSASKYRLHQAAQKAAEDTPAGTPQPPARGRRNSGSELELGLDGGAGEARRRGAAAQEVELEPPGPGLDGAELHAPNRMQLASRDRRTSDAAV